jgi:hypothetical protein
VALALFSAARALGDRALAAEALTIARDAAALSPQSAGIVDACVCHGSAGLGHIYNRLYQATGCEALRSAAVAWLVRAMDARKSRGGAAGFLFWGTPDLTDLRMRFWADRSLLSGTVGLALALISACGAAPPMWDRLLLLDVV